MTDETKRLVLQMSAGTFLGELFLGVIGFFLGPVLGWTRLSIFLGLAVGWLCAEAMLLHMAVVTERVLESQDAAYANKMTVIHSIGRKLVYIALLLAILWKVPQVNVMAVVFGTMALKAGAYLQPFLSDRGKRPGDAQSTPDISR